MAQRRSRPARKTPKRTAGTRTRARRAASRPPRGPRGPGGHSVVHWEIIARDPKALHDFYGQLFGWKVNADNPMGYGVVTAGGDGINGGIGAAEGGPQYVTFYVRVRDLEATLRRAGQLGGTTVVPPTEIPNMVTFAVFTDPQGNRIGIIK